MIPKKTRPARKKRKKETQKRKAYVQVKRGYRTRPRMYKKGRRKGNIKRKTSRTTRASLPKAYFKTVN